MNQASRLIMKVVEIIVHYCPDLDAVFSVALILMLDRDKFQGISNHTRVRFVGSGELPKDLQDPELLSHGRLVLDTGFGPWDHHQNGNGDKCTLDLVAEALGVQDETWLKPVLEFVRNQDLEGKNIPFKPEEGPIVLTAIFHGLHLLHQETNPEEAKKMFWNLVEVALAVLKTAHHFVGFKKGWEQISSLTPNHQHTATDHWTSLPQAGYMRQLWSQFGSQHEICPASFAETVARLDELNSAGDENFVLSEDLCRGKLLPFMFDQGYYSGSAENATFTLWGVAYGLWLRQRSSYEPTVNFLAYLFQALAKIDDDWFLALADWQNLEQTRLLRYRYPQSQVASKQSPRTLAICAMVSNSYAAARAARFALGDPSLKSQVVVCFREKSYGDTNPIPWQTQITCPNTDWWRQRQHQAVVALRAAEWHQGLLAGERAAVKVDQDIPWSDINMPGVCSKVPQWFSGVIGSNRSKTNPTAPRTSLTRSQILRLVQNVFYFGKAPSLSVIKRILEAGDNEAWPEDDYPYLDFWRDGRLPRQERSSATGRVVPRRSEN